MTFLTHMECALCGKTYDADRLWQDCPDCGRPLLARYDLDAARRLGRERLIGPEPSLWRYRALLPVRDDAHIVEGGATVAALRVLLDEGWIDPGERVILFNTGSGLKYPLPYICQTD